MKRTMMIGTILLLAGMLAVPVFARGPGQARTGERGSFGPGDCWNQSRTYAGANLTEEQQARVEELVRRHDEQVTPIRNELWAKQVEMKALMVAETLDESKVKALQKEINTLRSDLSDKRIDFRIELRKIDPDARFAGRMGRGGSGRTGSGPFMKGGRGPGSCRD